jgi:hypothetical protein
VKASGPGKTINKRKMMQKRLFKPALATLLSMD